MCHIEVYLEHTSLNEIMSLLTQSDGQLANEQNGFRNIMSKVDQLLLYYQLTPTFSAFADFKKAYDTINRSFRR